MAGQRTISLRLAFPPPPYTRRVYPLIAIAFTLYSPGLLSHLQMMWPDHCVQGSKGAEFHPSLDVSVATTGGADAAAVVDAPAGTKDGDRMLVVQKGTNAKVDSYSGFGDQTQDKSIVNKTCLEEALRANGIKTVYVCGEWPASPRRCK